VTDYDALVQSIYAASGDQGDWDEVARRMADFLAADCALLVMMPPVASRPSRSGQLPSVLGSHGTEPGCLERFLLRHAMRDSRLTALQKLPAGSVWADRPGPAYAAFRRSRLCAEFWQPAALGHAMAVLVGPEMAIDGANAASSKAILGLARRAGAPPFTAEQIAVLAALGSHVRQSLTLRELGGRMRDDHAALSCALDYFALPVMLIDSLGRLRARNRAAEDHLAISPAPLVVRDGLLQARRRREQADLRAAISAAADSVAAHRPAPASLVQFRNRANAVTHSIMIVPAGMAVGGAGQPEKLLLLFLSLRGHSGALSAELAGREFGLTMAEARLLAGLAGGRDLARLAVDSGVAIATLRVQLKHALAKTATHSQAQLVVMALRGLTQLRFP
jgi:DNA-binding CsgD family transcriptional regulator